MNYVKISQEIIDQCGGNENVSSITHCATRLRLFIKDKSKTNQERIKRIEGVIGTVYSGDELQIILGKHLIPIYNVVAKSYESRKGVVEDVVEGGKTDKNSDKNIFSKVIGFVSASVTPMVPGLVAGGMLKVFLLLITLVWSSFADTQSYIMLDLLSDVPFYFMPVFIAYGAAKKLGGTPIYAMIVTASLVYPDFVKLLTAGKAISIIGIHIGVVKYSSTLLPALLISICAYYCEKMLVKIIPGIIKSVLVGMVTIVITYILGITILGPLGDVAGGYLVHVFLWSSVHLGPVAVGLLAGCMPLLVMTGMHHAVTPLMVQAIANPGYDVLFRPAYLLHNMAEGGACIGVGLRAKNKKFRAECFSLAFGCIIAGVTEPAIYGVHVRLKRPLYGVMAGGAAGGVVAGIMGATSYVYGYSTILAIPIFKNTILAIVVAIIVAIVVSAVVTILLGFDENDVL